MLILGAALAIDKCSPSQHAQSHINGPNSVMLNHPRDDGANPGLLTPEQGLASSN